MSTKLPASGMFKKSGDLRRQNPRTENRGKSRQRPGTPLEEWRNVLGLSIAEVAREAEVDWHVAKNIFEGRTRRPQHATLARINAALTVAVAEEIGRIASLHFHVMWMIAVMKDLDPIEVTETDFDVQRPRDPKWLTAVQVRGLTTYILVCEFAIPAVRLSAAIDITRTAIGKACRLYEDRRDDEIDEIIAGTWRGIRNYKFICDVILLERLAADAATTEPPARSSELH